MDGKKKLEQKLSASDRKLAAVERLSPEQEDQLRENWVADAGSRKEKKYLEKWAKQVDLKDHERAQIRAWIDKPGGNAKRNDEFWRAAKRRILGPVIYDTAIERHKLLIEDDEWLLACLTAQGIGQREIAKMIGMSESTVDKAVRNIKDKVQQSSDCDISSDKIAQITRWFFGF
jgi:ATP/maltotriose-dependent transcriptional regulator MalT